MLILQNLKIEIDRDIATNLYTGIATATNNFTSYSVNAETFENIATLLRSGAVKKMIRKPPVTINKPQVMTHSAETQPVKTIESLEKEIHQEKPSSKEWLKPKIFKGGGLI